MSALHLSRDFYLIASHRGTEPTIAPEGTDLAIWTHDVHGTPYAIAFRGKAQKPFANYSFRSDASRNAWIAKITEARRAELARKAQHAAERKAYRHDYKVGEILVCSWGYDQTNVDFYQVVSTTEKTIELRKIAASVTGDGPMAMSGHSTGIRDEFVGDAFRVKPSTTGGVSLNSYKWASRWNGKPERTSWYA